MLLKVTMPIAHHVTAEASALKTSSREVPSASYFSGALPAGDGPGTFSTSVSSIARVGLTANPGHFLLQSSLSLVNTDQISDGSARFSAGVPDPLYGRVRGKQVQWNAAFVDLVSARETLNVNLTSIMNDNDFASTVPGFRAASFQSADYTRTSRISLQDTRNLSSTRRVLLGVDDSFDNHGNGGFNVTGALDIRLGPDAVRFGLSHGALLAHRSAVSSFADPQSASYDCTSGTIVASGPNQQPTAPRATDVRLGWTHQGRSSQFNFEVAGTRYENVSITGAYVPIDSVPVAARDPGYAAALIDGFTSIGGCVRSSVAPRVYLSEDVGGSETRYLSARAVATTHIGRRLVLQYSGAAQRATLVHAPPLLLGTGSPYVPGHQLPGIPVFRGTATLDLPWNDRRTETILNADFVGSNNQRHLPPYLQVTAGIAHQFGNDVDVYLVASNAAHSFVGSFNSPQYSTGVPAIGGGTFRTFAAPLVQPNVYLDIRVKVRRGD
jgi:hypothetical protein